MQQDMRIFLQDWHHEWNRKLFWAVGRCTSVDGTHQVGIRVAISEMSLHFRHHVGSPEALSKEIWQQILYPDLESVGEHLWANPFFCVSYSETPAGQSRGLQFLQEEIK